MLAQPANSTRSLLRRFRRCLQRVLGRYHLHVVRHTVLEKLYHQGKVPLLSLEDYAPLVVDCLEILPPEMIIMRLMGDAPRSMLVAPTWSLDKRTALQRIAQELERRETYQGRRYSVASLNA